MNTYTCEHCQQQFDRKPHGSRPFRFCSRACSGLAQRTRVTLRCSQCHEHFERKAYMADWSQERGPFCGFRCYAAWQRLNSRGTQNPNYSEASTARGSSQWERNRALALDRDGHQCQKCGAVVRLHVHHVKSWDPDDLETHAVGNLLTLCAPCHKRVHPGHGGQGVDGKFVARP